MIFLASEFEGAEVFMGFIGIAILIAQLIGWVVAPKTMKEAWYVEPTYYEDTGRRVKSNWTSDHKRARKRRQYARRRASEEYDKGNYEKALEYEE